MLPSDGLKHSTRNLQQQIQQSCSRFHTGQEEGETTVASEKQADICYLGEHLTVEQLATPAERCCAAAATPMAGAAIVSDCCYWLDILFLGAAARPVCATVVGHNITMAEPCTFNFCPRPTVSGSPSGLISSAACSKAHLVLGQVVSFTLLTGCIKGHVGLCEACDKLRRACQ